MLSVVAMTNGTQVTFQMRYGSRKEGGLRAFVESHTEPFGHHGMK